MNNDENIKKFLINLLQLILKMSINIFLKEQFQTNLMKDIVKQ